MKKIALMSILIATFWIPIAAAARFPNAKLGTRKVQKQLLIFCACWALAVLYILPRI